MEERRGGGGDKVRRGLLFVTRVVCSMLPKLCLFVLTLTAFEH